MDRRSEVLKASPPMFENRFLDRFTRVHPVVPLLIYVPVIALLFEYGVLGVLAGTVGSVGAMGLTWGVSRYALDIPWRVAATEHLGGIAVTGVLVAAIGVLSSLDVLRHKPLATLRAE